MSNIKNRNTAFMFVIFACLVVGINSKRFLGDWSFIIRKRDKFSSTTVITEGIQNLVLDKVFLWNYLLLRMLLRVLHYIEPVRIFHEKNH